MKRKYIEPKIKLMAIRLEPFMEGSGEMGDGSHTESGKDPQDQTRSTAKENSQFNFSSTEIQSSIWDD